MEELTHPGFRKNNLLNLMEIKILKQELLISKIRKSFFMEKGFISQISYDKLNELPCDNYVQALAFHLHQLLCNGGAVAHMRKYD